MSIDRLLEMPANQYQVVDVIALRDAFHDKVETIVSLREQLSDAQSRVAELEARIEQAQARMARVELAGTNLIAAIDKTPLRGPMCESDIHWHKRLLREELAAPVPPAEAKVAQWSVEDVIEKIVEYGGHRENEGGSYATFQKSEARAHRAEADSVLAEVRAMLSAQSAKDGSSNG